MKKNGKFRLYLDGRWVESASGVTFPSDNPAKPKQVLGMFQKGNEEDVAHAVKAAKHAFKEWNETPAPKRGLNLLKAA